MEKGNDAKQDSCFCVYFYFLFIFLLLFNDFINITLSMSYIVYIRATCLTYIKLR